MQPFTISDTIQIRVETVWNVYTSAEDIKEWNHAADDWRCTKVINDLRIGGKLTYHMSAMDGSAAFNFDAEYTSLVPFRQIAYRIADGRNVVIDFTSHLDSTDVRITVDPESVKPVAEQQAGWQAILSNFKTYIEKIYSI